MTWCNENGVDSSKVEIFHLDDHQEYGLKVAELVKENELILEIPRKLIMTTESVTNESVLGIFFTK